MLVLYSLFVIDQTVDALTLHQPQGGAITQVGKEIPGQSGAEPIICSLMFNVAFPDRDTGSKTESGVTLL